MSEPESSTASCTELSKREILRLNNEESNRITRECLRMALVYLMNEKPFDDISITEIVKRSGVSRTAFYRNYGTKEDILKEIGEGIMTRLMEIIDLTEYRERTYDYFLAHFKELKANCDMLSLIISANIPLERLFSIAKADSIIERKYPSKNRRSHYSKIAAESAFYRIVTEWIQNGTKESCKEMAKMCETIFYPWRFFEKSEEQGE